MTGKEGSAALSDPSNSNNAFAVGVSAAAPELLSGVFSGLRRAQDGRFSALRTGRNVKRRVCFLLDPMRQPCGCELFAVAALFDKAGFERGDLLVEQKIGLVDQTDQGVGPHGGVGVFEPGRIKYPSFLIRQIRRIG